MGFNQKIIMRKSTDITDAMFPLVLINNKKKVLYIVIDRTGVRNTIPKHEIETNNENFYRNLKDKLEKGEKISSRLNDDQYKYLSKRKLLNKSDKSIDLVISSDFTTTPKKYEEIIKKYLK